MNYKKFLGAASAALMIVIAVTLVLSTGASAQSKFKTLHKFRGKDGRAPAAGLIFDSAGNLYGTTTGGGASWRGSLFKLSPNADGSWTESVLHSFTGGPADGANPYGGVIFDNAGNLYGTTFFGGANVGKTQGGTGTAFKLTPNQDGTWTESIIYSFPAWPENYNGANPDSDLIFDNAGNLYGTMSAGLGNGRHHGRPGVFELSPSSDGSWTQKTLYFGAAVGGVIFDKAGNLYGANTLGGYDFGSVFELTPNPDGTWTEADLYAFPCCPLLAGAYPSAGVIFDGAGNLYGTTTYAGGAPGCITISQSYYCGTVFELTPQSGGTWTESDLYNFTDGNDGGVPQASLVFDAAGNLYGTTTQYGVHGYGVVFKLTPNSNGGWTDTTLQGFADHPGAYPSAGVILDKAGNIYGTTQGDGKTTFGSVFEITP